MAGLRILLVEDEALAALVVSDALADLGHAVVHAADGETALALAATELFDVLVTDLAMPRLSGLQLIPLLRSQWPELPVIMMTGWLSPDGARLLAAADAARTALLLKPFDLTRLTEALSRITAPPEGATPGSPPSGKAGPQG